MTPPLSQAAHSQYQLKTLNHTVPSEASHARRLIFPGIFGRWQKNFS
jgi:hypothetical protein